jgi:NAD(P)H-hydrate epimerase
LGEIHKRIKEVDSVLIGPGLGKHYETQETIRRLIPKINVPFVIDADAINAISKTDPVDILKKASAPFILTPHQGELSRLLGISIAEVSEKKLFSASEWANLLGGVLVIKGSPTIIADQKDSVWININGNDGMATAGSGDVLSGIIASFLAQGLNTVDAARLSVYIHGLSGDIAATLSGKDQ